MQIIPVRSLMAQRPMASHRFGTTEPTRPIQPSQASAKSSRVGWLKKALIIGGLMAGPPVAGAAIGHALDPKKGFTNGGQFGLAGALLLHMARTERNYRRQWQTTVNQSARPANA